MMTWILALILWLTGATSNPCPGDVNGDGIVNILDLSIISANYLQTVEPGTNGDLNFDGVVNHDDLDIVADNYGNICRYQYTVVGVAADG